MWPILHRELREQARSPAQRRLRWATALLGIVLGFAVITWTRTLPTPGGLVSATATGAEAFSQLGLGLTLLAALLATLATADTLARERREGTLPILFLTPLTASAVVVGKAVSGTLRVLSALSGVIPVLIIPVLMGGVDARQIVATLGEVLLALLLGLGGGILASTRCQRPLPAMALGSALAFAGLQSAVGLYVWLGFGSPAFGDWLQPGHGTVWLRRALEHAAGIANWGGTAFAFVPGSAGPGGWLPPGPTLLFLEAGCALVLLGAVIRHAGRRTARDAQVRTPTAAELRRRRFWIEPWLFRGFFTALQRANLARNPLRWLQRRTPLRSVAGWLWLGLTAMAWTSLITGLGSFGGGPSLLVPLLPFALLAGMVLQAAGAFRAERETGTIELLLVTGLTEGQMIGAVLHAGIWMFLPAVALHSVVLVSLQLAERALLLPLPAGSLVAACLTLPGIGLWTSLRGGSFASGIWQTFALGLGLPGTITLLSLNLPFIPVPGQGPEPVFILAQGMVGAWALRACHQVLRRRQFTVARDTSGS